MGVPPDKDAARRWLKAAAEQQCEEAAEALAQLDEARRKAPLWRRLCRGRKPA